MPKGRDCVTSCVEYFQYKQCTRTRVHFSAIISSTRAHHNNTISDWLIYIWILVIHQYWWENKHKIKSNQTDFQYLIPWSISNISVSQTQSRQSAACQHSASDNAYREYLKRSCRKFPVTCPSGFLWHNKTRKCYSSEVKKSILGTDTVKVCKSLHPDVTPVEPRNQAEMHIIDASQWT